MINNQTSRPLTLFLQRSTAGCRFLCASFSNETTHIVSFGEISGTASIEEVRRKLDEQNTRAKQVVLLMPRSELVFNSLEMPEVEEKDLAGLVYNLVMANAETSGSSDITTDFIASPQSESRGRFVLAWSLPATQLKSLKDEARECGFQLKAVTVEGLGAVSLWRRQLVRSSPDATIFSMTSNAFDFAVIRNGAVSQLRSIPRQRDSKTSPYVPERLIHEYRRTLTVLGIDNPTTDEVPANVFLFGTTDQTNMIAENLASDLHVPVSVLNPLEKVEFTDSATTSQDFDDFVHLLGIAGSWGSRQLEIDLCNPRRPEVKRLPWRRIAFWFVPVAALLWLAGFLISDDLAQSSAELRIKQQEFLPLRKDARRVLELGDELAAIRNWRKDEVVWLDQLDQLTDKLPPREQSLIRRISMSSTRDGQASIDLSVEVNQPDLVLAMENAIRSKDKRVVSKRVSESTVGESERWTFETNVRFPVVPPALSFPDPIDTGGETEKTGAPESGESNGSQTPESLSGKSSADDPATKGGEGDNTETNKGAPTRSGASP